MNEYVLCVVLSDSLSYVSLHVHNITGYLDIKCTFFPLQ